MKIIMQLIGIHPQNRPQVRLELVGDAEGKTLQDVQVAFWYARRTNRLMEGLHYEINGSIIRFFMPDVLVTQEIVNDTRATFQQALARS